jgi:adenylylsulfate kinase
MIIQFCGLSGSGKTTIANHVKLLLNGLNINCEVIDGDVYRKVLCADLGFSKTDRNENIRRLAFVANLLASYNIIPIICAINPYDDARQQVLADYLDVKTVFVDCSMPVLQQRDTKQLYKKAMLPHRHPDRINNLTGVNDPFEAPVNPDLILKTDTETIEASAQKLLEFILAVIQKTRHL